MTERELIRRAAAVAGIRKGPARRFVRALVAETRRQLMGGYPVTLYQLGTLKVRARNEKRVQGIDGREHWISDRYVVGFKMAPSLKAIFRS